MNRYDFLHEVEVVTFRSNHPRTLSSILAVFTDRGFTLHEDLVSLDRSGKIPPWQHLSVVEVEFQYKGEEIFGFNKGSWDTINLKYGFATLPFNLSETFVQAVEDIGRAINISPEFRGVKTDGNYLRKTFSEMKQELLSRTGCEPGSEPLAIFIHSTYPRR